MFVGSSIIHSHLDLGDCSHPFDEEILLENQCVCSLAILLRLTIRNENLLIVGRAGYGKRRRFFYRLILGTSFLHSALVIDLRLVEHYKTFVVGPRQVIGRGFFVIGQILLLIYDIRKTLINIIKHLLSYPAKI